MLMSRLKSLHPLRSLPHLLTSKSHNQPSFHRSSLSHLSSSSSSSSSSPLPSASAVGFISTRTCNIHHNLPRFLDEIPPPANWGIVMVPENQAYLVERWGGWSLKILYPGIHFLIPVVDRIVYVHSLKVEVFLMLDSYEITKDDAHILIDSVVHVKIVDPLLASYQLCNQILVVASMSSGIMLENLRKMNLDEILEEMDTLNENIMKSTNEFGTPLGVKCLRYAISGISPFPKVGTIIERRAKAERIKLAQVSEGVLSIMSIILLGLPKPLIMSIIMNCFSLFCCFPGDVIHLLQAWHGVYLGKAKTIIWRTAIRAVWWSVWGERNSRCFRNLSNSAGTVASKAKRLIIKWVSNVKDLFGPDFFFLGV